MPSATVLEVVKLYGAAIRLAVDVPSIARSTSETPAGSVHVTSTVNPAATPAPFDGDVIATVGGVVLDAPNSAVITCTSFCVAIPLPMHRCVAVSSLVLLHVNPNGDLPETQSLPHVSLS